MATVLQPIVNELNTVLVQLRTELRGLQYLPVLRLTAWEPGLEF